MRILIVNALYYPTFRGGAELSVQHLAEALAVAGNKVYVVCMGDTTKVYRHNDVIVVMFKERNVYTTYKLTHHNMLLKIIWHIFGCFNVFHYITFKKLINKIKPDLVNTNSLMGVSPIIWKAFEEKKVPVIHTVREYSLLCNKGKLFNNGKNCDQLCSACRLSYSLKKTYFHIPKYYIGISDFALETHKNYGVINTKSTVVYNPIPVIIPNTFKNKEVDPDEIVFGFIGRINVEKGVEYLVNEVINVSDAIKNRIKIVFAGEGEDDFVQDMAGKLIEAGIKFDFKGVMKQPDFFSQINVLLVPALWHEPFGRVAIESLSYSVPICMSGRGGLKELYNQNCCWLFEPSENNLTYIIEDIARDTSLIMSKSNASKPYANQFSVNRNFLETLKVFNNINNKDK